MNFLQFSPELDENSEVSLKIAIARLIEKINGIDSKIESVANQLLLKDAAINILRERVEAISGRVVRLEETIQFESKAIQEQKQALQMFMTDRNNDLKNFLYKMATVLTLTITTLTGAMVAIVQSLTK